MAEAMAVIRPWRHATPRSRSLRGPGLPALLLAGAAVLATGCGGGGSATSASLSGGTGATYTISGTVSGAIASGVTLALSGTTTSGSSSVTNSATTDASGNYSFSVASGSYTLTPSLSGYTFSPTSATETVSANVSGVNFVSTVSTVTTTSSVAGSALGDPTDYGSLTLTAGGSYASSTTGASDASCRFTSTAADVQAIKVAPGGSLTATRSLITKRGDTGSIDSSAFYGIDAGVLASSSSTSTSDTESGRTAQLSLTDCTIQTTAIGADGAFAFGEGATVTLDHVTIATTGGSNARGVEATYGGTVNVTGSVISTTGDACAALASDRCTGATVPVVNATDCQGTTGGSGSPGIYCTGTFTVTGCTLGASGSEAAVIEGKNALTLSDTRLAGAARWGVLIYQSQSGDSSTGVGAYTMTGGTLTNTSDGALFVVCDTDAAITLTGATLVNPSGTLLLAGEAATALAYNGAINASWGTLGGGVTFTATDQTLGGNLILCDSASTLALTLTRSTLSGAIDTQDLGGTKTLTLDSASRWTATADSHLTTLTGVALASGVPTNVDAATGITITCGSATRAGAGALSGTYTLASGGTLVVS
jgi:hypothetical protein